MTMTLTQKLKYFRDQMVSFFKDNPQGKYYKVIGWKTQYSPILDVLPRVKEVIPNAKKATLTIIGDDPLALSFEESTQPFPERSAEEIVDGWIEGYELERMKSPDGLYAEVKFPCKFQLQGGLPDTFDIKWRGSKPKVWHWNIGGFLETGSGYITIGYDPIKGIIMNNTQIKDSVDDITVYANINGKNYNITNKAIQIKTDKQLQIKTWLHKRDRNTNYQQDMNLVEITIEPNSQTNSINYTTIQEYWGYVLEAWGYKPWDKFQKELSYLSKFYNFNKSKQMPCQERYDVDIPSSLSLTQKQAIKEVFGYDIIYHQSEGTQLYCLGLWPKTQQEKTCSKQMYRDTMVNYFKNNPTSDNYKVIGWKDKYSPILDVSARVKKIMQNVSQATLTIYGDDLSKIQVSAPYDTKPPSFTDQEIIQHWQSGVEIERAYCQIDNKWYYVYFPCKLETKQQNQSNNTNNTNTNNNTSNTNNTNNNITPISPQPTNTTTEIKNYVPFALLALGAAGIYLYSKRKYKRG